MKSSFLYPWLAASIGLATAVSAADLPIVGKARAWLGTEEALNAIHSLHYDATAEAGIDSAGLQTARMDIVFQKPRQESMTTVAKDLLQRQALDGFNGWMLRQPLAAGDPARFDPGKPQALTILGPDQVQRLQAEVRENLYFYSGVQAAGGSVEDLGPATVDGVACEKVVFHYNDVVSYIHYFDQTSGRLVLTETNLGAKLREQGEQVVQGVRFPHAITLEQDVNGKPQKTVVTLNRITVNEALPDDFFGTPPPPLPLDRPVATRPAAPAPAPGAAP